MFQRIMVTIIFFVVISLEISAAIFPSGGKDGCDRRQNQTMRIEWSVYQFDGGHVNIKLWNDETSNLH